MKSVACIVMDGFAPFEFGVVCEAFGLDRESDGVPNFDFRVVTPEPGAVTSKVGFSVNIDRDLSAAADADIIVMCPVPRRLWGRTDERVLETVRAAAERRAWILSVCSGSFVLAQAGILDGKRATTHWMYTDELVRMYPAVDVDPDVLFVQEGRIITSAGTAAGLDACLHLLRQEIGAELTNRVARRMVVAPQRDGGQAQFIERPLPADVCDSLADVADWALAHLDAELPVDELASRAHMSPRTFARRFKAEFGATPASWLARQRVIYAQRLLENTALAVDQIARDCGFGSAAVLRQTFARVLGTTPTAYRATFSCRVEEPLSA